MRKYIKANRVPESEEVVIVIKGDIKYTGGIYDSGFYDCFEHYAETDDDVCDACRSYLEEAGMDDVLNDLSELSASHIGYECAEELRYEFADVNYAKYGFYVVGDNQVFEVFMAYELAEGAE